MKHQEQEDEAVRRGTVLPCRSQYGGAGYSRGGRDRSRSRSPSSRRRNDRSNVSNVQQETRVALEVVVAAGRRSAGHVPNGDIFPVTAQPKVS